MLSRSQFSFVAFIVMFGLVSACNNPISDTKLNPIQTSQPLPQTVEPSVEFDLFTQTPVITESFITPTPNIPFAKDKIYAVIQVNEKSVLDGFLTPGTGGTKTVSLQPHSTGLTPSGKFQKIGEDWWVEIESAQSGLFWVDSHYLIEQTPAGLFCNDNRVTTMINQFIVAVQSRNGSALSGLISPTHGLSIRHEWWNPEVNLKDRGIADQIFDDTSSFNWGVQDGSGEPIMGSFRDVILPKLDDVFNQATQKCNTLDQGLTSGGTAGFVTWPFEYANVNYIALYRQALPGDDLNWRTWAIGIEYVLGEPYIAFLVQYHWEI
jgi:hypothetical protein